MAAAYAHVTAPLRRLADRYATEACLALTAGLAVPEWAREALPKLPKVMSGTDRVSSAAARGAVDLAEAVLLQDRVGETFDAGGGRRRQPAPHGAGPGQPRRTGRQSAAQSRSTTAGPRPVHGRPAAGRAGPGDPGHRRPGQTDGAVHPEVRVCDHACMAYDPSALPDVSGLTVAIIGGTGDQGRGLAYRLARAGQRC